MLIDMHAHVVPRDFPPAASRASAARWPSIDHFEATQAKVMIAGENFRTIHSGNWDVERRLGDMATAGVDAEAISPMPELLSYWFTPEDALEFCRYTNEFIAGMIAAAPGRFFGLGAVPLQEPDLAARELANIKAMGLTGIELGSNILGKSLGEPQFLDFFMEAERLEVPIFVHALHPTIASRIRGAEMNAIGFPTDTGLTIASFIGGGTAEKTPNLRIAFSHGGGTFPFMLPRYTHDWGGTWNEEPGGKGMGAATLPRSPAEYARRFYYDTLLFDARTIRYLLDIIGESQLLAGTDYPYMKREQPVGRTLSQMGLSQPTLDAITWDNCFRFLGVEPPTL
ncbi:MAG TPA: amidohydrolase family protein [Dehalococcoidia bacterium]|nr:amidohydrolase family protein [Dehalococcoidia bacterium]